MLLTLFGGSDSSGPAAFNQTVMNVLAKEVESSVGISLVLGSTASGNSFVLGSVSAVAPSGTPSPNQPTVVIQDDGSAVTLWVWGTTTAAWKRVVLIT